MTNDLTIDIDQIRSALTYVLNAVERDHGPRLQLDGDAYWSLPVVAAFDLSKSDPVLTVGQFGDDVDAMRGLVNAALGVRSRPLMDPLRDSLPKVQPTPRVLQLSFGNRDLAFVAELRTSLTSWQVAARSHRRREVGGHVPSQFWDGRTVRGEACRAAA